MLYEVMPQKCHGKNDLKVQIMPGKKNLKIGFKYATHFPFNDGNKKLNDI